MAAQAASADAATTKYQPSDFLKAVLGRPVIVKLNSGVTYRGVLACLDGYMNIAMEQTEEYARGRVAMGSPRRAPRGGRETTFRRKTRPRYGRSRRSAANNPASSLSLGARRSQYILDARRGLHCTPRSRRE